jgi:hypothetical protein
VTAAAAAADRLIACADNRPRSKSGFGCKPLADYVSRHYRGTVSKKRDCLKAVPLLFCFANNIYFASLLFSCKQSELTQSYLKHLVLKFISFGKNH